MWAIGAVMLLVDERNPRAVALHEALAPHLDVSRLPADLRLVFGGDGYMLSSIHSGEPGWTYLGLNAGYLGFLLNDVSADPAGAARKIMDGEWTEWRFPRLRMRSVAPDGTERTAVAVNDIYVERQSGQTARLRVSIDGVLVVQEMVCDGLLTATALGSTAYSFSAGGVPCHPMVKGIQVTPICPHAPRLSPIMLPHTSIVEVEVLRHERRPVRAVADGVEQGPVVSMTVETDPIEARFAFLAGHHFTQTMMRKVLKS